MGSTFADRLDTIPRKNVAARLRSEGETLRKRLADPESARIFGRILARALELSNLTKQQAATTLGYPDQSAMSRWCAGVEAPPIARLLHELGREFRRGFMTAMAEWHREEFEVETTIKARAVNQ